MKQNRFVIPFSPQELHRRKEVRGMIGTNMKEYPFNKKDYPIASRQRICSSFFPQFCLQSTAKIFEPKSSFTPCFLVALVQIFIQGAVMIQEHTFALPRPKGPLPLYFSRRYMFSSLSSRAHLPPPFGGRGSNPPFYQTPLRGAFDPGSSSKSTGFLRILPPPLFGCFTLRGTAHYQRCCGPIKLDT